MEAAGLIEYCPAITPELAFVNNINPFAAVPKSDGTVRIIIDPTSTAVNSHMAPLDLRLPSVEFALGLTKPHSILGKRDLKSGFHHVVLAPESRRFMGFRHPSTGQIGRWVVLPFGAAQSPAIFCQITAESARIFNDALRMHNIRATVVVYVDDYLIIADSHADLQAAIFIMDSLGAALGLIWNLDKDVLGATSLEFLGLNIDAARQQISLPDNKRQKYLAGVLDFISTYQHSASCPRKAVEKLTGQLAFAARSMRWGALFINGLYDALGAAQASTFVIPSELLWDDLAFWAQALGNRYSEWHGITKLITGQVPIGPQGFHVQLYTDASGTYGWGATLLGQTVSGQWDASIRSLDLHIGWLELEAIYRGLVAFAPDLFQQRVLVLTDNTQALAALNRGTTRHPEGQAILHNIALLGLRFHFEVKARHVPGVDNPADAPSRGLTGTRVFDWTFRFFSEFASPVPTIDCCAAENGYNRQRTCTSWYSIMRPVQNHISDIAGNVLWANPPWAAIPEVLEALLMAFRLDSINTIATIVLPRLVTTRWYRRYFCGRTALFQILHTYPVGSQIYLKRCPLGLAFPSELAPPCQVEVMVVRLGGI